jgi:DNA-binding MarR family transcriptional regulator
VSDEIAHGRAWQDAVPNDRLAHLVRDAARGLTRALTVRLAEQNVSFGHWTFLRVLWEQDGLTQRELSEQAGLMEPTTFTALQAMEQLGYIRRARRPDSRRKVYIHLTDAGRALKETLVPLAEAVNAIAVRGADPTDVAATRALLVRMIANLAADDAACGKTGAPPLDPALCASVLGTTGAAPWPPAKG